MVRSPLNSKIVAVLELCLADPVLFEISSECTRDDHYVYIPRSFFANEGMIDKLIQKGLVEPV